LYQGATILTCLYYPLHPPQMRSSNIVSSMTHLHKPTLHPSMLRLVRLNVTTTSKLLAEVHS